MSDIEHCELWFRAKRYGWGWTPVTWQGWLVIGAYLGLILAGVAVLKRGIIDLPTFLACVVLLTAVVFGLCWIKGEKPRWRWGDK